MIATSTIYRAPPDSGNLVLGRSLLSLLDEGCDRHPNEQALNQWRNHRWQSLSNSAFRTAVEECALGLLSLGLERGDRVALVMQSDSSFCIVDMGCLLAGLVNVPVDLTQTIENILFILQQAEAKALVISNRDLLNQLAPYLSNATTLQWVIVAEGLGEQGEREPRKRDEKDGRDAAQSVFLTQAEGESLLEGIQIDETQIERPSKLSSILQDVQLLSLEEIQRQGQKQVTSERLEELREAIAPHDLATILYIASETKLPKGVMLSHENISADILAAFSSFPGLQMGAKEAALLFLPLTHIFARAFFYGHLAYGHSVYFSDPNHVVRHLKTVNPTILITVPRLLEKIYERILEQGRRLSKFDRAVFFWALKLAQRYELGQAPSRLYALRLRLADRLVFARWRAVFGDRLKALISGGAALRAELTTVFSAAGIPVLQGYGLTETSAVLCYNRGVHNRAGTVGMPIAGVEIAIAEDGEILIKSPFVMQGYYRDPQATQQVLDAEGWFHTGDLGEITADGFLKITGVKKSLFKLATGKYVSPLPLEEDLMRSPLVAHALAVGANQKFCGMLIFANQEALRKEIAPLDLDLPAMSLQHPCTLALYQSLIDRANCHLPYWSTVRKFKLIDTDLSVENGLLKPDGTLNRVKVLETFASDIATLYEGAEREKTEAGESGKKGEETALTTLPCLHVSTSPCVSVSPCPRVSASECPIYARSLTHY